MRTHFSERANSVRTFEMVETTALRRRIEDTVERLLIMLDEIDGDPDLEAEEPEHDDDVEDALANEVRPC
jgi:hypothetical protein